MAERITCTFFMISGYSMGPFVTGIHTESQMIGEEGFVGKSIHVTCRDTNTVTIGSLCINGKNKA